MLDFGGLVWHPNIEGKYTLTCFLPELETRTGLEYLTRLWGWLKLVGPVEDICNFWDLKYKKCHRIINNQNQRSMMYWWSNKLVSWTGLLKESIMLVIIDELLKTMVSFNLVVLNHCIAFLELLLASDYQVHVVSNKCLFLVNRSLSYHLVLASQLVQRVYFLQICLFFKLPLIIRIFLALSNHLLQLS